LNDLTVKNVGFCGAELLAVQEKETGKIYTGINSILRELGFDEKQIEYRRDKWTADKVLSKGTRKFSGSLLGLYTSQDTWCIEIKRLPLALAKIEITPKMEKEMPELSGKLEKYQDECADVLAAAFLPKTPTLICMADVQAKDPLIRLFKTEGGGIVLLDDNVYSLTPDVIDDISRFVPEMQKYGISQIKKVLMAFLDSMNRSGKLEEIASWGVGQSEPPKVAMIEEKPKRRGNRGIMKFCDPNAPFITKEQAMNRYNMCSEKITKLCKESGAWIKYGRAVRIDTKKMDEYLRKEYAE